MKSIFSHRVTRELLVPGTEPEQTITIRKLAPRHLEKAALESQRRSMENVKAIGGPALLKEYMGMGDKPESKDATPEEDATPRDPMSGYDRVTLIASAVMGWSFDEPVSEDSIAELDDETADWLGREVLKLAKPRLFQTKEQAEASRGNDSGPSTSH